MNLPDKIGKGCAFSENIIMIKYPEFYNDIRIAGRRIKLYRVMRGKIIFMNPLIKKILNKIHK